MKQMATLLNTAKRPNFVKRFINSSIEENLPKKYKRSALITTLLSSLCDNINVCKDTLYKIESLFMTGTISADELKYGQILRGYIWSNITDRAVIDIDNKKVPIAEAIEIYKNMETTTQEEISYLGKLVEVICEAVPSFIKYGSDRVMKYDIYNALTYIREYHLSRATSM